MPAERLSLGFVAPRYGSEIVGGAEALAKGFAEKLPRDRFDVEVLTTCARNHHTWKNELPPGESRVDGVTVRRFAVSARDVGAFLEVQQRMSDGLTLELDEELAWAAGSVNSEALYDHLDREGRRYDALVFLPYLFGTTLLGTQIHPRRSVLIPCLHDEPFAYLRIVAHLFRSVRGVLFNSAPERSLARRLFGGAVEGPVVGFGFDPVPTASAGAAALRARHGIDGDYLLYFGRKEGGKNLPLLLDCFRACREAGEDVRLVVAGDGSIDPADRCDGVVDLPRLSEEEKRAACADALAVCQPSTNESFSIVLMEAWLQQTPVLVNAACPVTCHHVGLAEGGLYFADAAEFAREVRYLRRHADDRRQLGRQGRDYVLANYSWPAVIGRFESGLAEVLRGRQ